MCQTVCWKSKTCNHRWMSIVQKCNQFFQSSSFTTPIHGFKTEKTIFGRPKYNKAAIGSCPECDMKGMYNHQITRMVIADGCREFKEVTGMEFNKYTAAMVVNPRNGMGLVKSGGVTAFQTGQMPLLQGRQLPQIPWMPPMQSYLTPYQQSFAARQQMLSDQQGWPMLTSPYMSAPQTQRTVCYLKWTG